MLWAGILSGDIFPPSPGTGTPLSGTAAKRGSSGRDCATIFPSTAPQSSGRVSAIMRTANAAPTKPNVRHTAILWRGCTTRGATATTSSTGRTITRKPNGSSRWKCRCAFWQRCSVTGWLPARSICKTATTRPVPWTISSVPPPKSVGCSIRRPSGS